MNVVVDTNVVVSAIFWPGESRECLALWAKRRFQLAITIPIFEEYCEVVSRLSRTIRRVNPNPWLNWIESKAKVYEPTPLGKRRSRDPDDDPFLACALASNAKIIVSKDNDLIVLEKPFGIEIFTPRRLLARFR
jgi:putative PIN family toxin of toxin-antitoxin system